MHFLTVVRLCLFSRAESLRRPFISLSQNSESPLQKRQDGGIEADDPSSDPDGPSGDPFSGQVDGYPSLKVCQGKSSVAKDKFVFYSKVGDHNDKPQKFANQLPDGVLMRESFPSGFTDKNRDWTGCKGFMERTLQAFAEKTSDVAYILVPTDDTDISKTVWTKIEKPALITSGGACTRFIKVDPDNFDTVCVLWDRNGDNDAKLANRRSVRLIIHVVPRRLKVKRCDAGAGTVFDGGRIWRCFLINKEESMQEL